MNSKKYTEITICPVTGSEQNITYLDLGDMPLVNNLNETKESSLNCEKFPLKVNYFSASQLSVLSIAVEPEILYNNYSYKSGISLPYKEHCREMFQFLRKFLILNESDKILDIGGNDGTLLKTFLEIQNNLTVMNVDASENLTQFARDHGIPSQHAFWGYDTAVNIGQKFKLITTTNCFQHTLPVLDFVKGVAHALAEGGIWCLEFPYWLKTMETFQFDQVYHEHIYYFNLISLRIILEKFNLSIIEADSHEIHGGSLRVIICHVEDLEKGRYSVSEKLNQIYFRENLEVIDYIEWGKSVSQFIDNSRKMLEEIKNQGYSIAGFGAAAKGCIFLNSAGIDYRLIDFVIDDTDLKQGKFIPGTGIPIVSREILKERKIDYILILAHNFADYIIKSLRNSNAKFIVMFPKMQIFTRE